MGSEFTTSRLFLRPLTIDDAPEILTINSFDSVRSQLITATFTTIPETITWLQNIHSRPASALFTVSLLSSEDKKTIGVIGLNGFGRLLYMFHPDSWGKGYCTEALKALQERLWEVQPGRGPLVAAVHDGNEGSLRVLLKCGFVGVGSFEEATKVDGDENKVYVPMPGYEDFKWFRYMKT